MSDQFSAWAWPFITIIGVAVLGAALVYGTMMWRRAPRNSVTEEVRDEVTREHYREGNQGE